MAERKTLEIVAKLRDLVSKNTGRIRQSVTRMASSIRRSFVGVGRVVFNLRTALLGLGGLAVAKQFNDAGSSVEQFKMQLGALFDDEERAKKVLAEIRKFAAESPLATEKVVASFVQLEAVGIKAAEQVTKTLGNVALIFNRDLQDVTSGFISFETEVLRRLGVEMKRTGDTAVLQSGRIRIETENTADAIRAGLLQIWEERFPDAMERAQSTFKGKMATFKGAIYELGADLSEVWLPALKDALDNASNFINDNRTRIVASFRNIGFAATTTAGAVTDAFSAMVDHMAGQTNKLGEATEKAIGRIVRRLGTLAVEVAKLFFDIGILVAGAILRVIPELVELAAVKTMFLMRQTLRGALGIETSKEMQRWHRRVIRGYEKNLAEAFQDVKFATIGTLEGLEPQLDKLGRGWKRLGRAMKRAMKDSGVTEALAAIRAKIEAEVVATNAAMNSLLAGPSAGAGDGGGVEPPAETLWDAFIKGAQQARDELKMTNERMTEFAEASGKSLSQAWRGGFVSNMKDALDGAKSFEDAWNKAGMAVVDRLKEIVLELIAIRLEAAAMKFLDAGISAVAGVMPFARGGVVRGGLALPVPSYAAGGIVRGPIYARVGDNRSRTEAVVPMADGRTIPVDLRGEQGGGQTTIIIQAIDSRSFAEAVARNPRAIVSVVRGALRSEPGLRGDVRRA